MNILVRGTNWVGDAVMAIPALRQIRRIFPDSRITLHTRSWAKGIFQDAEFIDDILSFESAGAKFKDTFTQVRALRTHKYDLVVLFPNSFESALVAKLSKISVRFGYAKEGRSALLTNPIKIPAWKNSRHEIYYYLNLVAEVERHFHDSVTVLDCEPEFALRVSEARKDDARKILTKHGVDPSKKIIAIVPGSTNSRAKRWPDQRFASLNDKFQNDLGAEVILLGAENELDVSQQLSRQSNRKPHILTGKTTIAEATAILSVCDLLVSNDTGPAHIAAALGIETLVIFGPTNPVTTQPWNSQLVRREVDCAPCMLRDCPIDHRCMTRIDTDEVFEKAKSLL